MNITFYRIMDQHNAGDMLCSPRPHFEFPIVSPGDVITEADIREWRPDEHRVSIFGGGGLLYHELHDILWDAAICRKNKHTGPIIVWGAGENMHNQKRLLQPDYLHFFDAVGLRDWRTVSTFENRIDYVPCPSCMLPEFDDAVAIEPIFPVVIYEHFGEPIDSRFGHHPRMTNEVRDDVSVLRRLSFLAQGQIILTNSWHGAYWGMLLGRKVAIVKGGLVSSRFHHFKHQPPIIEHISEVHRATSGTPTFIGECRNLNREFHKKVLKAIQ